MYIGEGGVRVNRKCSKVIVGCTNSERIQKYKCVDLYDRSRIRIRNQLMVYIAQITNTANKILLS